MSVSFSTEQMQRGKTLKNIYKHFIRKSDKIYYKNAHVSLNRYSSVIYIQYFPSR